MSSLVISGDTSGSVTLQAPAVSGTTVLTLPATSGTVLTTASGTAATATNLAGGSNGTIPYQSAAGTTQMLAVGTAGQLLQTNGAGAPTWATVSAGFTLGTPVATTSGTSVTFTGIPAGVKQIIISFVGVSSNGTERKGIRLGDAGGIETSGYTGASFSIVGSTIAGLTNGARLFIDSRAAVQQIYGSVTLTLENAASYTWSATGVLTEGTSSESIFWFGGTKTLSQELTSVQIQTEGANTFDGGEVNIAYI